MSIETISILKKGGIGVMPTDTIYGLVGSALNKKTIKRIYKTFSGYVHTNYSHVMGIYGGTNGNLSFNLGGVPSDPQKLSHYQLVEQVEFSLQHVIAFMAGVFKQVELCAEINRSS